MSRILLLADAGSTTGFARVSHAIGDRLVRDYGHDIHVLAVNYDGDAGQWDTGLKLYLANKYDSSDTYGRRRYVEMLAEVMPDVVMMINDPYVVLKDLFRNRFDEQLLMARTRPFIAYMPVDGTNQPAGWNRHPELVAKLPKVPGGSGPHFYPVAMTQYGGKFFNTADVIYHGVEERYRPATPEHPITTSTGAVITNKAEAKAVFGFTPDQLMVLRVDRNSHRKNFGDTWRALVPVMKRHSNVVAWFHCRAEGDQLEITQLLSRDPETANRFFYPGNFSTRNGWAEEDVMCLYAAADIFVSTSWGEGFGLTLAEACAFEVPVVAQAVSSIPEVVGPGGILLKPERLTAVESGQDQWLPDVKKFTIAIERLVASAGLRQSLGEAGRKHVVSTFSWDVAARQFNELITRVAQENPVTPILDNDGDDHEGPDPEPDDTD